MPILRSAVVPLLLTGLAAYYRSAYRSSIR
jgi:hypothetical protein